MDKGHGRIEHRTLTSSVGLNDHLDWPGVAQVCRVRRERRLRDKTECETTYFVTSLPRERANAAVLLQLCRRHWGAIENGVHYVRDTTFDEDRCTIATGHAPQNLAALRNAVLNWLRCRKSGNLAATIRSFTRNPLRLFSQFGFVK